MKINILPPYVYIIFGMISGAIIGLLAVHFEFTDFVRDWVTPFGEIFLRALKFIAIPLVLFSLIKGIGTISDMNRLTSIGIKSLIFYIGSTLLAITIGVVLVSLIKPGEIAGENIGATEQFADFSVNLTYKATQVNEITESSPLQPIVNMIPENAISTLSDNGAMLQVIVIALLIGVATIMVGSATSKPFLDFVSSIDSIIIKCIDIIMGFAPIGVMSLIATMVCENSGDMLLLGAVGLYFITVIVGLMLLMCVLYPTVIALFSKVRYMEFMRAMLPVQLMGFSTSSSAATLATTMNMCDKVLKLPKSITSFTLPLGVTINMDGTSIYQAIAVIFIAQVMNIDLTFMQLLTIIATTTLSSIGTPGVPGGSIVVSMMVLGAVGIPVEGLALIMGVDRPLDMLRTSVNVTGDVAVSILISRDQI